MLDIKALFGSKSYPLNKIYLSKERLLANFDYLSKLVPGVEVAPVLKSNAYGHGIEQIGQLLASQGQALSIPFICVDSLYEAYQLQKIGVKSDILIMGYIDPRSLQGKKLPFSYAVFDMNQLRGIAQHQPGAKVHLFFDTGMHREGFDIRDANQLLHSLGGITQVKIEGVMSHLAVADDPDDVITKLQMNNFKAAKLLVKQMGYQPKWFHLGGSYALLNELTEQCNVIRSGIALYGFPTASVLKSSKLQPVLKMTSRIASWKYIKKGEYVGYNKGFRAWADMILAILPIGYNDGVDKRLSNKGEVFCKPVGLDDFGEKRSKVYDKLPHKVSCKIVGQISMNITTIDLTEAQKMLGSKLPAIGDEVEVISDDSLLPNSIEQIAERCGTIPHEILIHLHPSTRREVV